MSLVSEASSYPTTHINFLLAELQKALNSSANPNYQPLEQPRPICDTLEDFEIYLKHENGLASLTITGYRSDVRALVGFLEQQLGRTILTSDVTADNLRAFIAYLRSSKLKGTTVSRQFQGLRRYSTYLVSRRLAITAFDHNNLGIHFKRRDTIARYLTQDEFKRLLEGETPYTGTLVTRNWALVNCLYFESLSVREALQLKLKDLDLESGSLTIGDEPRPLTARTIEVLGKYLTQTGDSDAPLFPSKSGRHLMVQSYRTRIVKPALKRVAPDYSPTSLHPRDWPAQIRDRLLTSLDGYRA